jgi:DNA polymerase-3 subunit gamma/tau
MARLDRLERRMTITGGDPSPAPTVATEPASVKPAPHVVEPTVIQPVRPAPPPEPAAASEPPAAQAPPAQAPAAQAPAAAEPAAAPAVPAAEPEVLATIPAPTTTTAAGSTLTLVDVRRLWPDIVEATKQRRRLTWIYLTQQAQVVAVDDKTLTLGFANAGARDSFDGGGSNEIVRQAAIDVVGHDWRVETIVDPGANPEAATPPPARPSATPAQPAQPAHPAAPAAPETPPDWAAPTATPTTAPADESGPVPDEPVTVPGDDGEQAAAPTERPSASARQAIAPTRGSGQADEPAAPADPDGGARPDDTDAESSGLDGTQLLADALGAQVIEEIPHS